MSLSEFLERWLSSVRYSVAPSTYASYEPAVRLHIAPEIGAVKMAKLSPGHVEVLKSALLAKNLSACSVKKVLIILSNALNRAVKWELIARNPARGVTRPNKVIGPDYICLTEQQSAKLVDHARGTRYEALYHLALKYGPRIGELLALTWRDIDLDRGTLIIRRSKTGQGRTLRLSPGTVAALERHRKLLTRRGAPRLPSAKAPVFPAEFGDGHQRPHVVRRRLARHLKEADLPRIRFHDLRDTAATLTLEDGFPVHRVARILGHADPAMTLRRYAHVLSELEQEGAERLDKWAF